MKHGSLFSGIGGFDLAAEWMGWENMFHCEWNEFGQKILKHYWPNAASYGDITKTDFTIWRGKIDILTGGFPCQPYSTAGKRKGKEDDRHLWPEMLRAIREIQPGYVVGENVRGLTNWNGGMVFDEVQADLEAEGYEVLPFLLPACGVNAPHRRDRIWFVAYYTGQRLGETGNGGRRSQKWFARIGSKRIIADTPHIGYESSGGTRSGRAGFANCHRTNYITNTNSGQRRERRMHEEGPETSKRYFGACDARSNERAGWQDFPTQPPICSGNDGISARLDFASVFGSIKQPRKPAVAFGKWRNESIKAAGNAIVPQVAYQIFKAINQM